MKKEEFAEIRRVLGKTQKQMAQLLGVSIKAVQSLEQGYRNVSVNIERQVLFLMAMKKNREGPPCWDIKKCNLSTRVNCPAWEFQIGNLCWFVNGTICCGEVHDNWHAKMEYCRECEMFHAMLPQY